MTKAKKKTKKELTAAEKPVVSRGVEGVVITLEEDGLVFQVGDKSYRIPEKDAGVLRKKDQDVYDFTDIESLENWVTWTYLRGTLDWDPKKIASVIGTTEEHLLQWTGLRATQMNKMVRTAPGKVEEILEKLREKFAPPEEAERKPIEPNFNKVITLYREGNSPDEIAKKLGINTAEFRMWWQRNLPVINRKLGTY